MAGLPPVMEAAVRMVEVPMGEEEVGMMMEGFGIKKKKPVWGVMPMGEHEEFWMVEMVAMEAMTEAKVEMETSLPKRPRGCPEGQHEQAEGNDTNIPENHPPHVWPPFLPA
jgi:hypothetical protein